MKYLLIVPISVTFGKVRAIIRNPYPEQMEDTGLFVEAIPNAEDRTGMYPVLMINLVTKELFYNYEAFLEPPIFEDPVVLSGRIADLETQNTELMLAVAELANVSETDKMETQHAIAELASTITGGVA